MSEFFRFPHTEHIAWLGQQDPRDDKVLSPDEAQALLEHPVFVEEKVDGANLGFSLTQDLQLQLQNRGHFLTPPYTGQFSRLSAWLAVNAEPIRALLKPELILFGEWCAAKHSLLYTKLPDWYLAFDIFDRQAGRFWSAKRRDEHLRRMGLSRPVTIAYGKVTLESLKQMVKTKQSHYRDGTLEGVVIRHDDDQWCLGRAKLVRQDFIQAIDTHWKARGIEWNRLANA